MSRLSIQIAYALVVAVAITGLLYARGWLFDPRPPAVPSATIADTNILIVHYHERPPYYVFADGKVTGLCGEPASRALAAAGVPFCWQQTPPQRQLQLIQSGPGLNAGLGWYETPERQSFARFSTALYRDRPTVALVRRNDTRFAEGMTVDQLLSVSNAVLLAKESYSYGDWLDERMRQLKPVHVLCTGDNLSMLRMVEARRADYFFLAEEEADELMSRSRGDRSLRVLRFAEMPPGASRHLMLARRVPEDWVERINRALRNVFPSPQSSP